MQNVVRAALVAVLVCVSAACDEGGAAIEDLGVSDLAFTTDLRPGPDLRLSACTPSLSSTFAPLHFTMRARQPGLCPDLDVLASMPVGLAGFESYMSTRPACRACAVSEVYEGPQAPMYNLTGLFPRVSGVTVNVASCVAVFEGADGPSSCAAKVQALEQCRFDACRRCGEPEKIFDCMDQAELSVCASYRAATDACLPLITGASRCQRDAWKDATTEADSAFYIGPYCGSADL